MAFCGRSCGSIVPTRKRPESAWWELCPGIKWQAATLSSGCSPFLLPVSRAGIEPGAVSKTGYRAVLRLRPQARQLVRDPAKDRCKREQILGHCLVPAGLLDHRLRPYAGQPAGVLSDLPGAAGELPPGLF